MTASSTASKDSLTELRRIIPANSVCLLYVDHIESEGDRMSELACEHDLEGIIAKHRQSRYVVENGNRPLGPKLKTAIIHKLSAEMSYSSASGKLLALPRLGCL